MTTPQRATVSSVFNSSSGNCIPSRVLFLMNDDHSEDDLLPQQRQEVECELDVLNQTAPQINILENKLLVARINYQETLTENTKKLEALSSRLGKCVQRARPYYEMCGAQAERLVQIQRATKRYTNVVAALSTARAELARLEATTGGCKDTDSLEKMNQAILRINVTKKEVTESYNAHQQLLKTYNTGEQALRRMERRNKSDIIKSRIYFETKGQFDRNMQDAKLQVDLCAEKVSLCKSVYADAMSRLERISVSVHDTRRRQTMNSNQSSSPPSSIRGQGVGAESVESFVELACPGADVFSSSPRLNEKTIFPPDSPPNNPVISPATNFHPFVNGLLQHVQDTAAQLIACDNSIRLNSPPNQITDPAPRPAPNSTSSCSQTRSQPSSYIQSNSDTAADLHFVADHTKSNIQSCRCVQRSFVNSSSSDIWDCLPIPQHMQETFLSSAFSTLYMKRAHSSSELPTSCVEF